MKYFITAIIILLCYSRGQEPDPITLNDILPANYDRLRPPKPKQGSKLKPVNVTVNLYVLQFRSVDETEMCFTIDLVLKQVWNDSRLIFPKRISGEKVVLDPHWRDKIWTPDVWFKNSLNTKLQEWIVPSTYLWLWRSHTVSFSARITLDLSCDMNMQKFPHDAQTCGVEIMGLMNPSRDLYLKWSPDPIRISKLMRLAQFDLGKDSLSRCDTNIDNEWFSCIRASFKMERRSGYFVINIYMPTVLIVFMSMLTFWIPPEAVPARITLGVTSLLTIITKQYQSTMPNVSYVVALNIWLSCCIAFVFFSLIEYAIVITLIAEAKKENASRASEQTSSLTPNQSLSRANQISSRPTNQRESSTESSNKKNLRFAWIKSDLKACLLVSPHLIDLFSRVMFPVAFILLCIIYFGYYTS